MVVGKKKQTTPILSLIVTRSPFTHGTEEPIKTKAQYARHKIHTGISQELHTQHSFKMTMTFLSHATKVFILKTFNIHHNG